jgi:RNase H-fold protein (predicted Holliday junction resolvase)
MFTYLGLDWGSKRVGLSFGDPVTGLVIPANYECPLEGIFALLEKEIISKKITHIVVGNPTNFKLQHTQVSDKITEFIIELKSQFPHLIIEQINENGSSQFAKDLGIKNKTLINHAAAVDILERYFYKTGV